jgi:hypothetical protein
MDQELIQEIASLFEGSRHGNSRFMKRMKLASSDVQTAVEQYLAANGALPPATKSSEPRWEITMPLEELVSIHLSSSGVPGSWFVQQFKKLSVANQAKVNARLVEIGHQPYIIKGKGSKRGSPITPTITPPITPLALNETEKVEEQTLIALLNEIRLDKSITQQFMIELGTAEDKCREQLAILRGIPYGGPLNDPFAPHYKPAHQHARNNRDEVLGSTNCGCFFCRAIFDAKVPMEFVENNQTALCPNCGIDAVIGDKAGFEITPEFLSAMFRRWFSVPLRLQAAKQQQTHITAPPPALTSNEDSNEKWPWNPPAPELREPEAVLEPEVESVVPAGIGANLIAALPDDEEEDEEDWDD